MKLSVRIIQEAKNLLLREEGKDPHNDTATLNDLQYQ